MKIGFLFCLFCATILLVQAKCAVAYDDNDRQFWSTVAAQKQLNDKCMIIAEEETRFADDFNKFVYQAEDIGIAYKFFDWLSMSGNFRYIVQENGSSWEHEARPHVNLTLAKDVLKFNLSNRSRFEYRYLTRTKDSERYRNLTQIILLSGWSRFKISPFVREEAFFNTDQDNYNQNRLSGGVGFRLLEKIKSELYYMWRTDKSVGKWTDANVMGVKLQLLF